MYLAVAWQAIRPQLIAYLRGKFIKLALKKILGSSLVGGFKGWLVKYLATELYDEIGEPLIHYVFNEAEYQANIVNGKLIVKRLDEARTNGNASDYDSATDDIFN